MARRTSAEPRPAKNEFGRQSHCPPSGDECRPDRRDVGSVGNVRVVESSEGAAGALGHLLPAHAGVARGPRLAAQRPHGHGVAVRNGFASHDQARSAAALIVIASTTSRRCPRPPARPRCGRCSTRCAGRVAARGLPRPRPPAPRAHDVAGRRPWTTSVPTISASCSATTSRSRCTRSSRASTRRPAPRKSPTPSNAPGVADALSGQSRTTGPLTPADEPASPRTLGCNLSPSTTGRRFAVRDGLLCSSHHVALRRGNGLLQTGSHEASR
jgi:hypothetical protein